MEKPKTFDQIRQEVDESQRTIVWPETPRNSRKVLGFLWTGDPSATSFQRAGLLVFALAFLLGAIYVFSNLAEAHSEDRSGVGLVTGLGFVLISIRLVRNALLRPRRHHSKDGPPI